MRSEKEVTRKQLMLTAALVCPPQELQAEREPGKERRSESLGTAGRGEAASGDGPPREDLVRGSASKAAPRSCAGDPDY